MTGADDIAKQESQPAKVDASHHKSGNVTDVGGDRQRGFLRGREPLPARLALEIPCGNPGQLPGVWGVTAVSRLPDHGEQDMLFILEPIGCLSWSADLIERHTWPRRGPRDLCRTRIEESCGHHRGVQIVVKR